MKAELKLYAESKHEAAQPRKTFLFTQYQGLGMTAPVIHSEPET